MDEAMTTTTKGWRVRTAGRGFSFGADDATPLLVRRYVDVSRI
jgi:hypothetical protein